MVEIEEIISIILKEGGPLIVSAVKDTRRQDHIARLENIQNDAYMKMKQEISKPDVIPSSHIESMPKEEYTQDSVKASVEDLKRRIERLRTGGCLTCTKPAGSNPSEVNPHLGYTKEQLAKNLILLEEHFKNYKCPVCIDKHLLAIEGYAEEGIPMSTEDAPLFVEIASFTRDVRKIDNPDTVSMIRRLREFREQVQEKDHAHVEEKELEHTH
jgi:hypothetical protein